MTKISNGYLAKSFDHAKKIVDDFYKRHPIKLKWEWKVKYVVEKVVNLARSWNLKIKMAKWCQDFVACWLHLL